MSSLRSLGILVGAAALAAMPSAAREVLSEKERAERELERKRQAQPVLECSPRQLSTAVREGGTSVLSLTVRNAGGQKLEWKILSAPQWLRIDPKSGDLGHGEKRKLVLVVTSKDLGAGRAADQMVIVAADAKGSPATVPVVVRVTPRPELAQPEKTLRTGTDEVGARSEDARRRGRGDVARFRLTFGGVKSGDTDYGIALGEYCRGRWGLAVGYSAARTGEDHGGGVRDDKSLDALTVMVRWFAQGEARGPWLGVAALMGQAKLTVTDMYDFVASDEVLAGYFVVGAGWRIAQVPKGLFLDLSLMFSVPFIEYELYAETASASPHSSTDTSGAGPIAYVGVGYTF